MKQKLKCVQKYWKVLIVLILIFLGTYFCFACNIGLPPGSDLENSDWLSFWGGFLSFGGSLYLGFVAIKQNENIIKNAESQFEYSMKPIVQCRLKTYKTSAGTPYIVLVTENIGKLIAYNVTIQTSYPDELSQSEMDTKEIKKLKQQPFTLGPQCKLSTPICWTNEKVLIDDKKIIVSGTFDYDFPEGTKKQGVIATYELTTKEMDLFDAIDMTERRLENV